MFKDFHKRLQNDIKKIVDDRVAATNARHRVEVRVSNLILKFACE
jgi:actin-related protein 3